MLNRPQRLRMSDVIILIPGIIGSVLKYRDTRVWPLTDWAVCWRVLSDPNWSEMMRLGSGYDDEVKPDGLVSSGSIFPVLGRTEGYGLTASNIKKNFDVIEGSLVSPGNFHQFAYDWRKSNAQSAELLSHYVGAALSSWQAHSGAKDAKVILLAHSMGGLVARQFLEVIGGWHNCRALITFGTPFRGSVKAIKSLHSGQIGGVVDLSPIIQSLESIYEILPSMPC
jgi:hypothetical protein